MTDEEKFIYITQKAAAFVRDGVNVFSCGVKTAKADAKEVAGFLKEDFIDGVRSFPADVKEVAGFLKEDIADTIGTFPDDVKEVAGFLKEDSIDGVRTFPADVKEMAGFLKEESIDCVRDVKDVANTIKNSRFATFVKDGVKTFSSGKKAKVDAAKISMLNKSHGR